MTRVQRSLSQRPIVDFSDRDPLGFIALHASRIDARGRGAYLLASLVGVSGFIGLLVAAHFMTAKAEALQVGALVWFLAFGVIRMAFRPGRRRF